MDIRLSSAFVAMPTKAKLAFYTAVVFALLLVLAGNGYAATPSKASLDGSYAFTVSTVKQAYWFKSINCTYKGVTNTYSVSGESAYTQVDFGIAKFDGKGNISITFTQLHSVNSAETNASPVLSCKSTGGYNVTNSGYIVFEPPQTGITGTGTYSVTSEGSGSFAITGSNGATFDFYIGAYGSTGIASTVLLRSAPPTSDDDTNGNEDLGTGVAVLQ
jgi:hypothetical protein